jgi:hypothetical protein
VPANYSDTQMETVGGGNSEQQCCRKRYLSEPSWICSYSSAMQHLWFQLKQHFSSRKTGTDRIKAVSCDMFVFFSRFSSLSMK